jgi:hypothetical protein
MSAINGVKHLSKNDEISPSAVLASSCWPVVAAHLFKAVIQLRFNLAQHFCVVGVGSHPLEAVSEQLMQAQQRGTVISRHQLMPVEQRHLPGDK